MSCLIYKLRAAACEQVKVEHVYIKSMCGHSNLLDPLYFRYQRRKTALLVIYEICYFHPILMGFFLPLAEISNVKKKN
jgi:hypothetical protein